MPYNRKPRWSLAFGLLITTMLALAGCGFAGSATDVADSEGDPSSGLVGQPDSPVPTGDNESATRGLGATDPSTGDDTAEPGSDGLAQVEPGWLVWVHHQEPPDLHFDHPDNQTDIAAWVREGLLEGLFGVDSTLSYYPELLAGEPTVTVNGDRSVTIEYRLRTGLRWSDGEPLTADDVAFTHQILVEGCGVEADGSIADVSSDGCFYERESRLGYDLVTRFDVIDDTTFVVRMASFFAGWRDMYAHVFAEHAFGTSALVVNDALEQWRNGDNVLPSSGPLVFAGWDRGSQLRLARNDAYHGANSPEAQVKDSAASIAGVAIVFEADQDRRHQLLTTGDAHLMMAPLDTAQLSVVQAGTVSTAVRPGSTFEHVGMNLLDPHLQKPAVRQAVAHAIDRRAIVAQVYAPLVGDGVAADGLGNAYWMANHPAYQDHQAAFAGANTGEVARLLTEAEYSRGGDGVWTHAVDGQLRLKLGTTSGDSIRDAQVALISQQLQAAGIGVDDGSAVGGLFYQQAVFAGDALDAAQSQGRAGNPDLWDLAVFSWSSGPWPGVLSGVFRGGSAANPYGLDEPRFNVKAVECDAISDGAEQANCYNELDQLLLAPGEIDDALVVMPLSQRPYMVAYNHGALQTIGVVPGMVAGGPLVNVADFVLVE